MQEPNYYWLLVPMNFLLGSMLPDMVITMVLEVVVHRLIPEKAS